MAARDLSRAIRQTLTDIESDPELSRLVTVLESLRVAAAMAEQAGLVGPNLFKLRKEFAMDRFSLTDAQWEKMKPFGLGKASDPGRTGGDARLFVEAVLWIARTVSPWRDLPASFGNWKTVFKRFRDWVKADVFKRIFHAVSD